MTIDSLISGHGSKNGNWEDVLDDIELSSSVEEALRKELEGCERAQGFQLVYSVAGTICTAKDKYVSAIVLTIYHSGCGAAIATKVGLEIIGTWLPDQSFLLKLAKLIIK